MRLTPLALLSAALVLSAPLATLAQQVRLNASVMAYADSFWILGVGILISLLTLLILRKPTGQMVVVEAH